MIENAKMGTKAAIGANIFLFIIKITAGVMSNSIAIISDAINSFTDIFSSTILYLAVKFSHKRANKEHPFGYDRAEPVAALILAIITSFLGFELLKESFERLIESPKETIGLFALIALGITVIVKSLMFFYFSYMSSTIKSPAMKAFAVDSRNDVLTSSVALIGVILSKFGYRYYDSIAGIIISIWIFRSGYLLAKDNLVYLMGKSPDQKTIDSLKKNALKVDGVTGVNDIKAHYVGDKIQVELHAEVSHKLSAVEAHRISKNVQKSLEGKGEINKAFIHIDPRRKSQKKSLKEKNK